MTAEAAVATVDRWRKHGLKVGFTNGCFDIIHAGHVTYLEQARREGDRLIVAVNSDIDSPVLSYDEGEYKLVFTEPILIAVLAAPMPNAASIRGPASITVRTSITNVRGSSARITSLRAWSP